MRSATSSEATAERKRLFQRLVEEWKASRGPATTVRMMVEHPAYKAIIELGEPAVALLLKELDQEPDHWFAALRTITGANPVRTEDRGNLEKMAGSWIEWGRAHGYLWS